MTAKYWGRGPRHWTIDEIEFKTRTGQGLIESSPPATLHSADSERHAQHSKPRQDCHWTIHHHEKNDYESSSDSSVDEPDQGYDIEDESTWPAWKPQTDGRTFSDTIQEGLEGNAFSRHPAQDVPFSTQAVSEQRRKANRQRKQEEIGLAIMSRNLELLQELLQTDLREVDKDTQVLLNEMNSLHLAATYLDGSRQCCLIIDALPSEDYAPRNERDQYGHTVLDNIFLTILRSHTRVAPGAASKSFQGLKRYPGEEVDICGRWDADSPCIRQLYANGQSSIPFEWKHEFCHTSVQTVCHSMLDIFRRQDYPLDVNMPSGLFRNICHECGCEGSGTPFHTLVMVAYHLAEDGSPDETLFGALACLICLLFCLSNPFRKSALVLPGTGICDHRPMTPLELCEAISRRAPTYQWTEAARTGWSVFMMVLKHITIEHEIDEEDLEELDMGDIFLVKWLGLGPFWGAIQTEFLSYRRLSPTEGALSPRFDMGKLLRGLEDGRGPIDVELIRGDMMTEPNEYGIFRNASSPISPTVTEVCKEYFANVEQWGRIKFIETPESL